MGWFSPVLVFLLLVGTTKAAEGDRRSHRKVEDRRLSYDDEDASTSFHSAKELTVSATGHLPLDHHYPEPPAYTRDQDYQPPVYEVPKPSYKPSPSHKLPVYEAPKPSYQEAAQKPYKGNSIPGVAGVDYPIYNEVPYTKFSCHEVPYRPGMYANPEAGCQVYHVCDDERYGLQGAQFLCTNGTLFNQEVFNCDWWYNVDCSKATHFYNLNTDPERNPYYQKPYEGPLHVPVYAKEEPYKKPDAYQHPKPTYDAPKHSYNDPKPTYNAPKPTYNAPKPTYNAPKPTYNAPKPIYNAPKPYNPPAPIYSAPKPTYNAPKPTYNAPKPYNPPAPVYSAPKPSYSAPKPTYNAPKPTYNAPKPYNPATPTYSAPKPSYNAPIPSYNAPRPSYKLPVSKPAYNAPEPSFIEPSSVYLRQEEPDYSEAENFSWGDKS